MLFHVLLGTVLALILNMKFRGRRFLRTIVLIPWAMPAVVIGMAAKWGFNNDYGLINDLIRRFVPDFQFNWLINTGSARGAVISMDLWKDLPLAWADAKILLFLHFLPHRRFFLNRQGQAKQKR